MDTHLRAQKQNALRKVRELKCICWQYASHTHPSHIPPIHTEGKYICQAMQAPIWRPLRACPRPCCLAAPLKSRRKKGGEQRKTRKKFALRLMRSGLRPRLAARRPGEGQINILLCVGTHTHTLTHTHAPTQPSPFAV